MKILNINSYYYSSSVHRKLQDSLHDQGIDSVTYVPLAKGYIAREECQYGSENYVESSECYNKLDRYFFYVKHRKIFSHIKQRIDIEKYDCLHAHSLFSNGFIALKIKEMYGVPYIVAVRGTDLSMFFKYMVHLRGLGQKILKEATKIVFLSIAYRDYLVQNYVDEQFRENIYNKSIIIPNGIDDFWLKNKGEYKRIQNKNSLNLIHVGVVNRRKNLSTTVKAIEILRSKGYNIEFTVVGRILEKHIFDQLKGLQFINFLQAVSKEKLIEIYRLNDILVMPSITETFGLVYAEAMSQGLPLIYTRGQGFDCHFKDGEVGYPVTYDSPEEIATRILDIVNNYEAFSNNCINDVDRFDWKKIAKQYSVIYKEMI